MAAKLGNTAEGSIVKLKEDGKLKEFYVAKQDYESGRNGAGRVLLVRKICFSYREWNTSLDNVFTSSDIYRWLNDTYKNTLDPDIQSAMGVTTYYCTPGWSASPQPTRSAVFLVSATELGHSHSYLNVEGTVLPIAQTLKNNTGIGVTQGTRSRDNHDSRSVWYLSPYGTFTSGDAVGKCGPRPAFTLPASLYVTDDGTITTNTAPTVPASITVPTTVNGGTTITVSWTAASDTEGNLEGYIVERSTDGGSSWTQIYQGGSLSTDTPVAFGTATVMYRVKAYDTEGLASPWRTSAQRTVLNNRAPSAPGSISVPKTVMGGGVLTISWTGSSDSDGNLSGYALERQVDGGNWAEVYRGAVLTYTDSITRGWNTVAYRVRAYDSDGVYSGYTASEPRTVDNNYAPVIAGEPASGTDLGEIGEAFDFTYTVTDADGDAVTVREYLDDRLQRSFTATLGQENTFQAVDTEHWQTVLNGPHTLKVAANDGKIDSAPCTVRFTKAVHAASVTLAAPMEADAAITVCAVSVTGSIPADAVFKVEVTNNALDDAPVWEDCTGAVRNGANHVFGNKAAAKGFAFNFRVSVERGASGQGGYITSIQGGFQ